MHVRNRAARQACDCLRKKVCVHDTPTCTGMRMQHHVNNGNRQMRMLDMNCGTQCKQVQADCMLAARTPEPNIRPGSDVS
eukprot:13521039-Alexandrium_andersonii.AAC.1